MLVGQQFGPFTIDKELGSGAMGTVYLGRYTKTGQIMAIKIMAPGIGSTNAVAADRFEREITILKQLNHPNIVRFYGAGKQQGMRYFAMEFIDGESLDKVMARRGRMTWEEVVELGKQLCAALQHAHEKGIIHRDLKPSNVMVLSDGTLKLTDFGIAKDTDLETLTATNCTVGTASYMSPEQCKGERNITHKSDLYSLGIMFYELLTGQKPFKADSPMEMFMLHVNGPFERPSRQVLDIPVWLDTLVCQLLEKKPEQRPLDSTTVANTLDTIQEKVEAQQSAGVEAVRRRMIDRTPGQKRLAEEDKDAARVLLTGKGKAKRKQSKKPIYQKVWFQAIGLVLALGVVASLLYLVFRPPSADNVYQRAEKLMKAGKTEAAYDGPIQEYFNRRYDRQPGPQTDQIRAWRNQIEEGRGEEKLRTLRERKRNNKTYPPQEGEEKPFDAALAEDDGDLEKARKLWQQVQEVGSLRWSLVAANHLRKLDELNKQDADFATIHATIRQSGQEPTLEGRKRQASQGWRAEQFRDRRLARSLFQALKEETAKQSDEEYWHLYASGKVKMLSTSLLEEPQDKEDSITLVKKRFQEEVKEPFMAKSKPMSEIEVICIDIIALYENNESLKATVDEASQLRDKIDISLGRQRPDKGK
jgi:serine/threonine-protein kinase